MSLNRAFISPPLALIALAVAACSGEISGGTPGQPLPGAPDLPPVTPVPSVRMARLTHQQWANTVEDLFELPPGAATWASSFRLDPNPGGFLFENDASALEVDQPLAAAYTRAAGDVTAAVLPRGDLGALARWLPSTGTDADRARAFIQAFGERAHRRPLTAAEVDTYLSVFTAGVANPMGQPGFTAGLGLVVQAFLTSPRFLYRVETSSTVVDGAIPLDGYEVASRLSYFVWNSMPDDALFAAAADGRLTDPAEVARQAERMLQRPRAAAVVQRFHDLLLDVGRYDTIAPAAAAFPGLPADLPGLARQETHQVIADAFTSGQGWKHLLTTRESFVNQSLATLYGVPGVTGATFRKVQLPSTRRGVFTHIGFLASHATSFQPDPIHRGVYLTQKVACNPLGAPPADLPPLPAPNGRTNRELVRDHTESNPQCGSCHSTFINPYGFALEGFDATGQVRTMDSGKPVDTRASVVLGRRQVPVSDALSLADALATAGEVHDCYAKHWVEFAFGRSSVPADEGLVGRLGRLSHDGGSIRALILGLVQTPAFLTRSELEP